MDDAARMGVGDGLADGVKSAEEFTEDDGIGSGVVLLDDFIEGAAFDEAHDIIGIAGFIDSERVDRDDGGMFELSGDLGFVEEAFFEGSVVGVLGKDLFERDFAFDVLVARQVDESEAAAGVLAENGKGHGGVARVEGRPLNAGGARGGGRGGGRHGGAGGGPGQRGEVHGLGDLAAIGRFERRGGGGSRGGRWRRQIDGAVEILIDGLVGVVGGHGGGGRPAAGGADQGRGGGGAGGLPGVAKRASEFRGRADHGSALYLLSG